MQQQLEQALEFARARLDGAAATQLGRFMTWYYAGLGAEDLSDCSADDLYGGALSHWRFSEARAPREVKLRVYNPELEQHGWQTHHSVVEVVCDDMPFLVDSVRMALNRLGLTIHLIIHPVLRVRSVRVG